jgi:hypothetical protein
MYRAYIVLVAVLGLTLTACGNSYGDLCAASVQCEGGNDNDVNACSAVLDGAEQEAAAYGCGDAFSKRLDCIEKTSNCSKTHFENNCDAESEALRACQKAASGKK